MNNDELYEIAFAAILDLFYDTSVPASETIKNLDTLIEEIQSLSSGLEPKDEEGQDA